MKKLLMLAGVLSLAFMTSCSGCDQQDQNKKMDSTKEKESDWNKNGDMDRGCKDAETPKKCMKAPKNQESSECGMNEKAAKGVSAATPVVKKEAL